MTYISHTYRSIAHFLLIVLTVVLIGNETLSNPLQAQEPPKAQSLTAVSIKLNAAGAERVIAAARKQAEAMELKVNISVVDDGGHLLAFLRMDGARPGSIYTSQTKATTAALIRAETGPLSISEVVNVQLSLALENAAAASGGKFTTLKGGVPLVIEGQVVGAIGVGGATGEQDQQIGRAGAEGLVQALSGESTSRPR